MVGASTHHQLLATKSEIMVGDLNPLLPAALEKYEGIYIAAICPRTSAFLIKSMAKYFRFFQHYANLSSIWMIDTADAGNPFLFLEHARTNQADLPNPRSISL
jgi:hypothetical protein